MRILVVRLSHLGDVVHALGVHHALHAAYPEAELGWAIQPEFAELVEGLPGLARVVPFERRAGWRAWPRLRRSLRAFGAELAVDCQGNLKSAAVLRLSGARRRVGLARADWREPLGARVLTETAAPAPADALHAMDRMAALVRHVAPQHRGPLRLDAGLSPTERSAGEAALCAHLPAAGERPALVHLSSPEDVRGWPPERWEQLVRALADAGRGALVVSGPGEAGLGRALARRLPASPLVAHWVGQSGLRLLAATFEAAARAGLALVGCDSGPAHLAAAGGCPVVLLAGPQDPARTGPWPCGPGGPHATVLARERPACAPCRARTCTHADGPICMTRLEPADVLAALERTSPRRAPDAAAPLHLRAPVSAAPRTPHQPHEDSRR